MYVLYGYIINNNIVVSPLSRKQFLPGSYASELPNTLKGPTQRDGDELAWRFDFSVVIYVRSTCATTANVQ